MGKNDDLRDLRELREKAERQEVLPPSPQSQGKKVDDPSNPFYAAQGKPPAAYRWKKGQSGNPNGRPRKRPVSIVDSLLAQLARYVDGHPDDEDEEPKRPTWADRIAEHLIEMGLARKNPHAVKAIDMIINRVDGPVRTEISGPDGAPLFLPKVFVGIDEELVARGTLELSAISSTASIASVGSA